MSHIQPPPYGAPYTSAPAPSDRFNTMAIVGFVLTFVVNIAGLIVSIIALRQIGTTGERGRGLAIAGIILSGLSLLLSVLFIVIGVVAAASAPSPSSY